MHGARRLLVLASAVSASACDGGAGGSTPCETDRLAFRQELRCKDEFLAQAARPLDASLPGAWSVKTVFDRSDESLYFQDTEQYPLHSEFVIGELDWPPGTPFFEQYVRPDRRFVLGALTYYEAPDVWAYEIAPYDTASADVVADVFARIAEAARVGGTIRFHPTSELHLAMADQLPDSVPVITTEEIWAGIDYQPLNLGETFAQVRVLDAVDLQSTYVGPREIAVLDHVPFDISVVAAVVTEEFQTPLSHVNVLSQQRGTPNLGLRHGQEIFAPYEGQWVHLVVRAFDYALEPATAEEAEAWFEAHRPPKAEIPEPDYTVSEILDIDDVGPADVRVIGGKAGNYGLLRDVGQPVRIRDALAIPVAHYRNFLTQNGFDVEIAAMLADPQFRSDGNVRRDRLAALRTSMQAAPVDPAFLATLEARLEAEFPGTRMKFRSSTNAEDLARHTGAGLYESRAGQVGDPQRPVADALRTVWASVWNARAFEERDYAGIDHLRVAMAVLVNPSYTAEDANGVAISANIYDPGPGGEDGFYVNAQVGEESVVQPEAGVTADQLMYYYFHAGQPATYYTHSSLVSDGTTVLTRAELFDLGQQLSAVREHFGATYDPPTGFGQLPLDVEWKLLRTTGGSEIWLKQARPFPGRGQ
jgi:hypothetical protein